MQEEIVKRLIPIVGFMDNETGLLFVQTPTSDFQDFIEKIEGIENEKNANNSG